MIVYTVAVIVGTVLGLTILIGLYYRRLACPPAHQVVVTRPPWQSHKFD